VLATLGWAPDGPLPRRLVAARLSSLATAGPELLRAAPPLARTLPGGAVCVLSAPDAATGHQVAVRVGDGGGDPLPLAPGDGGDGDGAAGGRIGEALGDRDGAWTLLEHVPGPPDRVQVRRVCAAGATCWRVAATAGTADAVRELVGYGEDGTVLAVAAGPPPRLVAVAVDGSVADVCALPGADGRCVRNGRGQLGFLRFDAASGTRRWVLVAPDGATSETVVAGGPRDRLLGLDAEGRLHVERAGALVRFGADGEVDAELPLTALVVDGADVWTAGPAPGGRGLVVTSLTRPEVPAVTLDPGADGAWRLAGRADDGAFVLHDSAATDGPGTLARFAPESGAPLRSAPAPEDVWLRWFDLAPPGIPSVADDGGIDRVALGPAGAVVVRLAL
jgi:hypothetical protein